MELTWKHLLLIGLFWFSKTLCVKHYLLETQEKANASHTATTTPSTNLISGQTWTKLCHYQLSNRSSCFREKTVWSKLWGSQGQDL